MHKYLNYPQQLLDSVLEMLFPFRCAGCRKFITEEDGCICRRCLGEIPIKKDFQCIGCGNPAVKGVTCLRCRLDNDLDRLLVCVHYREPVISMIKAYKYRFVREAANPLSELIIKYLAWLNDRGLNLINENPLVCPVPLHPKRLNWRGFNQSEIIAGNIARRFQLSLSPLLRRKPTTHAQADLSSTAERLLNLHGVFSLIPGQDNINGRTVLLVDDVCTSGSTLSECAGVLKKNGAKTVIGLVIAKG